MPKPELQQTLDQRLTAIIEELVRNDVPIKPALRAIEDKYLLVALRMNRFNVTKTAVRVGLHRNTIHNKRRRGTLLK